LEIIMATRKPAVSTLLKSAQARIAELEKQLAAANTSKGYSDKAASDHRAEVDQIHAFLDALPGSIERQNKETYASHAAMTRLAAWLATK
jgi:uncharacterized coiled-coil protein SlyX